VLNAADSTVKGVELESSFAATSTLNFTGSIGYINAEFDEVAFFNPNTQQVEDVSNRWSFPNTPELTANLGFNQEFT
ncbi:hypothetical protein SB847_22360, partial [Bacillus sp. SIMBA_026]